MNGLFLIYSHVHSDSKVKLSSMSSLVVQTTVKKVDTPGITIPYFSILRKFCEMYQLLTDDI